MIRRLLLLCILFLGSTSLLSAHAAEWRVLSFTSDITVQRDTTLDITERLEVRFDEERRGIFRDIPYTYKDSLGQPYTTRIDVKSVVDRNGRSHPYILQRDQGPFLRIRVGDPKVFLTGDHHYQIRYTVERAYNLQENDTLVEIPWNVTGTWEVPLENVVATFHLPSPASKTICFTGPQGSTAQNCSITSKDTTVQFIPTNNALPAYHQMTAALQIPAASLSLPGPWQHAWWYLKDNYLLLYALVMSGIITTLWWIYGREYPLDSIMPRWEIPEETTPFHAQILHEDNLPTAHLSAGIIYLATRGYLTIGAIEGTKHFSIKKTDKAPTDLPPAEKKLYEALLGSKPEVSTSDLKNKFYNHIYGIKNAALTHVTDKKWFYKNPSGVRALYVSLGVVLMCVGAFWAIGAEQGIGFLGVVAAGIYWIVLGLRMPKKTRLGRKFDAQLRGLREYIGRAETLRLKVKNPPGHTRNEFDRLLPFAMVFGLEKAWAKQFEDVLTEAPDWISGDASRFTSTHFISALHSFSDTSTGSMTSVPPSSSSTSSSYSSSGGSSFGGGGFSGGGFGGGGGGSW